MSRTNDTAGTPVQPSLADLMARFLERQAAARSSGFNPTEGEVVPYEATPVQPVDPRLAWQEGLVALTLLHPGSEGPCGPAPAEWASLVASYEPTAALAFCVGNYPQLVRNLYPLLHTTDLAALRTGPTRPLSAPALVEWAMRAAGEQQYPEALIALGCFRLARQFQIATEVLEKQRANVPVEWAAAWANEEAALAWHAGRANEAAALWKAQAASVPVLFNRGMAALFLDRPAEARSGLTRAVAQLPEDGAWHHLGRLYLALAEMRG